MQDDEYEERDWFYVYGLKNPDAPVKVESSFHSSCGRCFTEFEAESFEALVETRDTHNCEP